MNILSKIKINHNIANKTWFGTGGKCKIYFSPDCVKELSFFLKILPKKTPVFGLGLGSNVIVRDGGFNGAIIKLGNGFNYHYLNKNKKTFTVGCALKDRDCANFCLEKSISGFEFLIGIPGTIGGALRMNAGCYDQAISDELIHAKVIHRNGRIETLTKKQLNFNYRDVSIPTDSLFLEATFKINKKEKKIIKNNMKSIIEKRKSTQPLKVRTGGSTFKNTNDKKAWELIEEVGLKGFSLGSAKISDKHANFIINTGSSTSLNLEILGEKIIKNVHDKKGIKLEWEIKRVGEFVKI